MAFAFRLADCHRGGVRDRYSRHKHTKRCTRRCGISLSPCRLSREEATHFVSSTRQSHATSTSLAQTTLFFTIGMTMSTQKSTDKRQVEYDKSRTVSQKVGEGSHRSSSPRPGRRSGAPRKVSSRASRGAGHPRWYTKRPIAVC